MLNNTSNLLNFLYGVSIRILGLKKSIIFASGNNPVNVLPGADFYVEVDPSMELLGILCEKGKT